MPPFVTSPTHQPPAPPSSPVSPLRAPQRRVQPPKTSLRSNAWNPRQPLIDPVLVGNNRLDIACPARTAVQVNTGAGDDARQQPIHANVVRFIRGIKGPIINATYRGMTKIALVGQSPTSFDLTERFLVQGLDSGRGLFQFVSPRTQGGRVSRYDNPVIAQLKEAQKSCSETPGASLLLAGRFEVTGFEQIDLDTAADDHCCYRLSARDRQNNGETKVMHITQVGLDFSGRLLRSEQIARASNLMDLHCQQCAPLEQHTSVQQEDPITVSYAGIGRSATLSAYREAKARFTDGLNEAGLDNAIDEIIAAGRRDRGPRFVHSQAQEDELKTALLEALRDRPATPVPHIDSPRAAALRREVQAESAMPVMEPAADNNAAAANLEHVLDAIPLDTVAEPEIIAQPPSPQEMQAFIAQHVNDTPLEFFEAAARKDPLLAAFCSVQVRRMQTASTVPEIEGDTVQSMHSAIECAGCFADRSYQEPQLAIRNWQKYALQSTSSKAAEFIPQLAEDLAAVNALQDGIAITPPDDACVQFPQGYSAALQTNQRLPQPGRSTIPEKLSADELSNFLQKPFSSSLDLMEDLAPHNPHAATFFNMVEHALIISNSRQQRPCNRYEYATNEDFLREQVNETNDPFLPTFLPGICRRLIDEEGKNDWRIEDHQGALKEVDSKHDVLRHVFQLGLAHLHAEQATRTPMPLFPLIFYELLAGTTGVPVPQYLKANEQRILVAINNNKGAANALNQQRQTDRLAMLEERKLSAEKELRECLADDINKWEQRPLLKGGFKRDIAQKTVDETLSIPSINRNPAILDALRTTLSATHDKQEISSRFHDSFNFDNTCYSRASWLSVFVQSTPEKLFETITSIGDMPVDAAVLEAIANVFQRDPVAFLQPARADDQQNSAPLTWHDNLQRAAHLGPKKPLSELIGDQFPQSENMLCMSSKAERFLKFLQLRIATAFRPRAPSRFMNDLEGLAHPVYRSQATTDVPIYLHRALELPLLVVEIDTRPRYDGTRAERTVSLRGTAPINTELAKRLEQLSAQGDLPADGINPLLALFKDIPVLWLETNHYTAYLPKQITQSPDANPSRFEEIPTETTQTPPPTPTQFQRFLERLSGSR